MSDHLVSFNGDLDGKAEHNSVFSRDTALDCKLLVACPPDCSDFDAQFLKVNMFLRIFKNFSALKSAASERACLEFCFLFFSGRTFSPFDLFFRTSSFLPLQITFKVNSCRFTIGILAIGSVKASSTWDTVSDPSLTTSSGLVDLPSLILHSTSAKFQFDGTYQVALKYLNLKRNGIKS